MPVGLVYPGAASNGLKLMLAGGCGWYGCSPAEIEFPAGISSTDGGASWDIFDIDGDYESQGLAWGNGRFVSVGDGAIYTTE